MTLYSGLITMKTLALPDICICFHDFIPFRAHMCSPPIQIRLYFDTPYSNGLAGMNYINDSYIDRICHCSENTWWEILAISGIKPGAFWLQDAFCNLLATFTDSILAPRWRGSCYRRLWPRRARRCGWTSAMCLFRWTRPATAPSSSSPWPSTTSLTTTAPWETGQQRVHIILWVKL